MEYVNLCEAKTHLSRLLHQVEERGEEIVLCRHNKPIAKIVPCVDENERPHKRELGFARGEIKIYDSFYEPMSDEELELYNNPNL